MQVKDLPLELRQALSEEHFPEPTDSVVLYSNPAKGSIFSLDGRNLILVPAEGYDYGDMVMYLGSVNMMKLTGWNVLGGPTAWLMEKDNEDKPAWLMYFYTGDEKYYIYQF